MGFWDWLTGGGSSRPPGGTVAGWVNAPNRPGTRNTRRNTTTTNRNGRRIVSGSFGGDPWKRPVPISAAPVQEPSLLDMANALYGQFGGGMSTTGGLQYDPEEWARRIVNPQYDAQIAALNQAAARAQTNAERGKAETKSGYQAIYNMLGQSGNKVGQTYDTNQEAAAQYAKQQQDTINAIYEKAKGESAANLQQLGITGDPTSKLVGEQANQVGMAAQQAAAGRTASEAMQTAEQNYYTGMGSASQLEGQAQQQALLRQLADTLAGYEGQKVTLEGERGSKLQEMMWNIMQANYQNQATSESTGPSQWDIYKFLSEQQGKGGGSEGPAPTKGQSAAAYYISGKYGDTPRANKLINFVINTAINDSGIRQGIDRVTRPGETIPMTAERAAQIVINTAKKKGFTKDPSELQDLANAMAAYFGRG